MKNKNQDVLAPDCKCGHDTSYHKNSVGKCAACDECKKYVAQSTMTDAERTNRMVEAILTSTTCGEACWYARETICRCSCGGRNHGCLLEDAAERPARTSRIHGFLYSLKAIGHYGDLARQADADLKLAGPKNPGGAYKYYWRATDPGSPVYLKAATAQQLASWKELNGMQRGTYLLWVRVEKAVA
jgi:hypothetical protein